MEYSIRHQLTRTNKGFLVTAAVIFAFTGLFDYLTTVYGVNMMETASEQNIPVQMAIEQGLLFEYIMGGSLLLCTLLYVLYRMAHYTDSELTWVFYEVITGGVILYSLYIVGNNLLVIF